LEEVTDTKPAQTIDKWQKKINKDFPSGLLMAWKGSESSESDPHYRVWKVTVVEMEGFDPVIELRVFDVAKTFVGRVTKYETIQENPLLVEVIFEDIAKSMVWSANISPQLAELMKSGPVKA
jgi:hypothetical protein